MNVEFEPQGNTTFIFPYEEVDIAEAFLAEAIRFFAAEGTEVPERMYVILRAMRESRISHMN